MPATVVFRGDLASREFIAFGLTSKLEALPPTNAGRVP